LYSGFCTTCSLHIHQRRQMNRMSIHSRIFPAQWCAGCVWGFTSRVSSVPLSKRQPGETRFRRNTIQAKRDYCGPRVFNRSGTKFGCARTLEEVFSLLNAYSEHDGWMQCVFRVFRVFELGGPVCKFMCCGCANALL
jgi:hypothetical protein